MLLITGPQPGDHMPGALCKDGKKSPNRSGPDDSYSELHPKIVPFDRLRNLKNLPDPKIRHVSLGQMIHLHDFLYRRAEALGDPP